MPLIGINSVTRDPRKPSALEQIESGVNIAAKVLGTGLEAYKQLGPDGRTDRANKEAQTDYYKAQAEEKRETKTLDAGKLSDVDKEILESYKDGKLTHAKAANDKSVAVYLPVAQRTLYFTPDEPKAEKTFDNESKLRNEFRTDDTVKAFRTVHNATKAVMDSFSDNDFERGDAGRDISLLYNFIKIMDPNSTVREGEVSLTTGASPVLDQAVQQYRKLYSDKAALLPPSLRKSLVGTIADGYLSREADFNSIVDHYKFVSESNGVDWNKVILPIKGLDLEKFKDRNKGNKEIIEKKKSFLERLGQ